LGWGACWSTSFEMEPGVGGLLAHFV
jgi:hypothetical protein